MPSVNLRPVSQVNREAVLALRPAAEQAHLVASVARSLTEVAGDDALTAYAVYDGSQRDLPTPNRPPVGFAVTEVVTGVG